MKREEREKREMSDSSMSDRAKEASSVLLASKIAQGYEVDNSSSSSSSSNLKRKLENDEEGEEEEKEVEEIEEKIVLDRNELLDEDYVDEEEKEEKEEKKKSRRKRYQKEEEEDDKESLKEKISMLERKLSEVEKNEEIEKMCPVCLQPMIFPLVHYPCCRYVVCTSCVMKMRGSQCNKCHMCPDIDDARIEINWMTENYACRRFHVLNKFEPTYIDKKWYNVRANLINLRHRLYNTMPKENRMVIIFGVPDKLDFGTVYGTKVLNNLFVMGRAFCSLALEYMSKGQFDKSGEIYRRICDKEPEFPSIVFEVENCIHHKKELPTNPITPFIVIRAIMRSAVEQNEMIAQQIPANVNEPPLVYFPDECYQLKIGVPFCALPLV